MKKLYLIPLLSAIAALPVLVKGQTDSLPNFGFEKWKIAAYPDKWDTVSALDGKRAAYDQATVGGTVEKDSTFQYTIGNNPPVNVTPHQGKYFLTLQTVASPGNVKVGYVKCKFPYTHRPNYVFLRMGFFPYLPGELGVISIKFTKWNSSTHTSDVVMSLANGIPLPSGAQFIPPWTQESAPLAASYKSSSFPDTAIVQFQSSSGVNNGGGQFAYQNNTTLVIDEIGFSATQPAGFDEVELVDLNSVSAYPNPFSTRATIHYTMSERGYVNLRIFDIQGREVRNLVDECQEAGIHDAIFDGTGLKNGIYFYRLQDVNEVKTGKLILSK